MQTTPVQLYLDLMSVIRGRLDRIYRLATKAGLDFDRAEAAAFHGRKVVEGIALGCLVATENGLKHIPRDARGQWNAELIFKSLDSKGVKIFPSPSIIRKATNEERQDNNVTLVVEGVSERRLSITDIIAMYQRMHRWLHELNPYVTKNRTTFYSQNGEQLWDDMSKINRFIEKHFISISGEGFFCVLRDNVDGKTKVVQVSKKQ